MSYLRAMTGPVARHVPISLLACIGLCLCQLPVTALPAQHQYPHADMELAVVGQIGGPTFAVAVEGPYAYMGYGWTLLAVDITDGSQPVAKGMLGLPGTPVHMVVADDWAYAALSPSGLAVIDLSDPEDPVLVDNIAVGLGARRVTHSADSLYVAERDSQLHVFDVGHRSQPREQAVVELPSAADDVTTTGDLLIVACPIRRGGSANRLIIYDTAGDAPLTELGQLDLGSSSSSAMYLAATGSRVYVAAGSRLHVIDVSTPENPTELGDVSLPIGDEPVDPYPGHASDVAAAGDYVYMAGTIGTFQSLGRVWVFDVTEPSNPRYVHRVESLEEDLPAPPRIHLDQGRLVTAAYSRLVVLDMADPSAPAVAGDYIGLRDANGVVAVHAGHLYVGAIRHLYVLDLTSPKLPRTVAVVDLPTDIEHARVGAMRFNGTTCYLALSGPLVSDLIALDVSTPSAPRRLGGALRLTGTAYHITVGWGHAYVSLGQESAETESTLRIIDVSGPAAMREVKSMAGGGAFEIDGGRGVMAFGDELRVLDMSSPTEPRRLGSLLVSFLDVHLLAADGRAYVRTRARSKMPLHVIDISDPTHMVDLGGNLDESVAHVFEHPYLYTGGCLRGVRVVDVGDPENLHLAASSDWPSCLYGIGVVGNVSYVSGWTDSLAVLELREHLEATETPPPSATPTASPSATGSPAATASPERTTTPTGTGRVFIPIAHVP